MFRTHSTKRRLRSAPRPSFKPRLEVLEDRCLLSATITDLGAFLPGAINNAGQMIGSNSGSAVLYSNGQMVNLGPVHATGINDAGQVVGWTQAAVTSPPQAFLYSNDQMVNLGAVNNALQSQAFGINDAGQVVGSAVVTDVVAGPFLYSNGSMGILPGFTNVLGLATARGINNAGQVVGYDFPLLQEAFLYSNGQKTELGTLPGDNMSIATGINDAGQIVGVSYLIDPKTDQQIGDMHAFLYSNGQMVNLGGDTEILDEGINDAGQVVFDSTTGAYLYSNGQLTDLNTLLPPDSGWDLVLASAINNNGQIIGTGLYNGAPHGYLLDLNQTSIVPTKLQWDTTNGGVDLSYQVSGGSVSKDTQVSLYWSSSDQFADAMGGPVYSVPIQKDTPTGTYGPLPNATKISHNAFGYTGLWVGAEKRRKFGA